LVQKFRSIAEQLTGVKPVAEAKRGAFLGIFSGKG